MDKELEYYQQQYARRLLSRREFLGRSTALGLSATAAGLLLTSADTARASTPVTGGRLRMGWDKHSASDTVNPNLAVNALDFTRIYQLCNTLVSYAPDLSAEPELAESWEPSADVMTWRFNLKKGVEFHNGRTMTSADVIYSLNRHRGDDTDSVIKTLFADVTDITADGDHTVVIQLSSPNADLPIVLGDMHTAIVPEGFTDFDNMIGTGPFVMDSFRPGVGMLAKRNPNYYGPTPYVDEVETFGIGDTAARINALLSGDIHYTVRVDPKSIAIINKTQGVFMANAKSARHLTFPMMADREPTNNTELRRALRYMVDRDAILNNVQKGYGSIGNDVPISATDRYFCDGLPQRNIDLDKAKYHLEKAGMAGGRIDLHTSEAAGGVQSVDIALLLRESAAKVGFDINVMREPSDGYWSNIWMKRPFHGANWMPRPTADLRFSIAYLSDAKWNEGAWHNNTFDALVKEARGVLDGPERAQLYCDAQHLMWDEGASIIPLFTDWLDARSDRVGGWTGHPVGEGDGFKLARWAWLTA